MMIIWLFEWKKHDLKNSPKWNTNKTLSVHLVLTDLLLIKSVWKIRKNSLKWEVASNWHLVLLGWNSRKKYVFTHIFFYKFSEFPTNRKNLNYSPPLIFKLKFIAFIIFLQNSNRSNMCAAIAQRRWVTRKFQIEENMRIVALKSTQKMPRRICAARCWKCPARNTCGGTASFFNSIIIGQWPSERNLSNLSTLKLVTLSSRLGEKTA